jgi:hypothetical protein
VCNQQKGGYVSDVSALYTVVLPSMFGKPLGRFRDMSFLSASLAAFCNVLKCDTMDYLEPVNVHPSERGTMIMGDIAIYQFLSHFESIIRHHCPVSSSAAMETAQVKSTSAKPPVIVEENFKAIYKQLLASHANETAAINANGSSNSNSNGSGGTGMKIAASFTMFSPNTAPPPPTDQVAIMCISPPSSYTNTAADAESGRSSDTHHNYFNPFPTPPAAEAAAGTSVLEPSVSGQQSSASWAPLHIVSLKQRRCAGWLNVGARHPRRTDDDHGFSPTATQQCPQGGAAFQPPCSVGDFRDWIHWRQDGRAPSSSNSSSSGGSGVGSGVAGGVESLYPHPFVSSSAMLLPPNTIQPVDLVLRVSNRLRWKHVWFEGAIACAPVLYWLHDDNTLKRQTEVGGRHHLRDRGSIKRSAHSADGAQWRATTLLHVGRERYGLGNVEVEAGERYASSYSSTVATGPRDIEQWIASRPVGHVLLVWHARSCFPFNLPLLQEGSTSSNNKSSSGGKAEEDEVLAVEETYYEKRVDGVLVKGSLVLFSD